MAIQAYHQYPRPQRCTHSNEDNFPMNRKLGKMPGGLYVWARSSWTKSNTKSGNGRNTETLSEPPGMKINKTKPRRDCIWPGVSKTTSRASLPVQGTKGRLEKMCAHCWMRHWATQQHRTWTRLKYWMLSLSQPLLARPAFRNPKLRGWVGKSGIRCTLGGRGLGQRILKDTRLS